MSMKILFAGGGTAGSVSPLLALAQEFRKRVEGVDFLWLGTVGGPEQLLTTAHGIKFQAITCGKWRRYFSLRNLYSPFLSVAGFFQAWWLIMKYKPEVVITAGSFVAVPVVWAAWFRGVPRFVHQQDREIGLANRLMAPIASVITVVWADQVAKFKSRNTILTGNPVRAEILLGSADRAKEKFGLIADLPVVAIMGGGTGSQPLNDIAAVAAPNLVKFCQVIHLTGGSGKHQETVAALGKTLVEPEAKNYHVFEFVTADMADILAVADLVVARAGMSTISELSALGKATVLIPMPNTHQEENARACVEAEATEELPQQALTPEIFTAEIRDLIKKTERRVELGRNFQKLLPQGAAEKVVTLVLGYMTHDV